MALHRRIVFALSVAVFAVWGLAACGGGDDEGSDTTATDDGADPSQSSVVPTTQAGQGDDGGSDGGDGGGSPGSATVTVSAGTFELQLEEACLISDIGIGAVASSGDATLSLAGVEGAVNVGFELSSGELWFAAAADVVVDGSTLSYSGPAIGADAADSTISLQVSCDELMPVAVG